MTTQVYAFAQVPDEDVRQKVYESLKSGIARFGMWEQKKSLQEEWHGRNAILLRIRPGDWIVYVNMPAYGKCVAARVVSTYLFDEGIQFEWGTDYRNAFTIDTTSILEFDRNDPNVLPSVNLQPRRRAQRVRQTEDFFRSLDNLGRNRHTDDDGDLKGVRHLKEAIARDHLPQITRKIHEMNRGKEFERFLHAIFDKMPDTVSIQNGFGWKSDNGADLIVDFENPIIGVDVTTRLVVQAKSYEGPHAGRHAVDQIVEGMKKYDADAGLIISTGESTPELESAIVEASEESQKTINAIVGDDVARFVLRYAPEFLLGE